MLRIAALIVLLAGHANAEPWYRGDHGTNRIVHLSITAVGFVLYPATAFVEDAADHCNWCGGPNAFDRGARDALVWSDTEAAGRLSDVVGYGVVPSLSAGLVLAGTLSEPTWAHIIDDIVPIAETMMVTQWASRGLKLIALRERPYSRFTDMADEDAFLSFPSAHTSWAFATVTSAGVIAHVRGYKSEPYIWGIGIALAAATGYFRIAADRHYLTDVLAGSVLGVSAGLTVPLLMRRTEVSVVATRTSLAVAGHW